ARRSPYAFSGVGLLRRAAVGPHVLGELDGVVETVTLHPLDHFVLGHGNCPPWPSLARSRPRGVQSRRRRVWQAKNERSDPAGCGRSGGRVAWGKSRRASGGSRVFAWLCRPVMATPIILIALDVRPAGKPDPGKGMRFRSRHLADNDPRDTTPVASDRPDGR